MDLTSGPAAYFLAHCLPSLGVLGVSQSLVAGPAAGMPDDDLAAGGEQDDLLAAGQRGDLVADHSRGDGVVVSTRT